MSDTEPCAPPTIPAPAPTPWCEVLIPGALNARLRNVEASLEAWYSTPEEPSQ